MLAVWDARLRLITKVLIRLRTRCSMYTSISLSSLRPSQTCSKCRRKRAMSPRKAPRQNTQSWCREWRPPTLRRFWQCCMRRELLPIADRVWMDYWYLILDTSQRINQHQKPRSLSLVLGLRTCGTSRTSVLTWCHLPRRPWTTSTRSHLRGSSTSRTGWRLLMWGCASALNHWPRAKQQSWEFTACLWSLVCVNGIDHWEPAVVRHSITVVAVLVPGTPMPGPIVPIAAPKHLALSTTINPQMRTAAWRPKWNNGLRMAAC